MGIVMYLVIMFLSYRVHDISLDGESWIKLLIIRRYYHEIISVLSWINIKMYQDLRKIIIDHILLKLTVIFKVCITVSLQNIDHVN